MLAIKNPEHSCGLGGAVYRNLGWVGGLIFAFFVGMGVNNHAATQDAVTDVTKQADHKVAALQKKADCEHRVAQKAKAVALQGIAAATVDSVPAPDPKSLPADNCPK